MKPPAKHSREDWRIPWGTVWATIARVYYLCLAVSLFFKLSGALLISWLDLAVASVFPALIVFVVAFTDGAIIWYIQRRPALKKKGRSNGEGKAENPNETEGGEGGG